MATKLGTLLMFDSYTSNVCMQLWGKSSYARAMIDLRANEELKDSIVVALPKLVGEGFNMCITSYGVLVVPKVNFKSTKQIYRRVSNKNGASPSGKKKQHEVSRQEVNNSNSFGALNSIKKDDDLGTNGRNSKSAGKGSLNVTHGSFSNSSIIDKIDKLERQILDGTLMFVDNDGNPLVPTGNVDSDTEVEVVFDETANLMASTSFKGERNRGYGTNSLLEQWRETKRDDDYDPYDDDLYESHDMSDHLQAICDDLDITFYAKETDKSDLVFNPQSAFIANRQILDGPFILNEVLAWCKKKRKQALIFKVDFAKAYDSVRWDFLLDVLHAFGFGPKWCQWICSIFSSNMASILVNGSPTNEFPICCGLKQGDPLAPFLFILVMESLHLSISRAITDGFFNGLHINASMSLSYLFNTDDAVFLGEWPDENLDNLLKILRCFHLALGLRINIAKSHVLGVGVPLEIVHQGASRIGCEVMKTPFKYLGIMVGDHMSRCSAWSNSIQKVRTRLSKWKVKTLSIGGRLTLLKSVLGAVPIYNLSIYKAPKRVLHDMEMLRSKFFNGGDSQDSRISWVAWERVLSSKKNGDNSLWSYVIRAIHGPRLELHSYSTQSVWGVILREVQLLASEGFDFLSRCKIRVGDGVNTRFWLDTWILDVPLSIRFPRLYALESDKQIKVAAKFGDSSLADSFRRQVRDGVEASQWAELLSLTGSVSLSSSSDRWICDCNGEGVFHVKDIRSALDDHFLPSADVATRWVKFVPIKVNIFAWRARLNRLPTRGNLLARGVSLDSSLCPICNELQEDSDHLFFSCDLGKCTLQNICRWWNLQWEEVSSFVDWYSWFSSIRLPIKLKTILEGVFYTSWWHIWSFRNRLIFDPSPPRRYVLFDDIVSSSFTWCVNRISSSFTWEYWLKNPYLISL
ncbi:RNA-directed DNA polymerase, eukaryota [Tanacetum coccineum]